MKMRQLSLITLAVVFAVATLAFAQAPQGSSAPPSSPPAVAKPQGDAPQSGEPAMMQCPYGRGMGFFHKMLGITDAQKKELRTLRVGFLDRTRKARAALFSLKDEKRAMLMSGNVDQKKLAAIDEQIVKFKTEKLTEKLKLKRDILAVFTPEQQQRLADLIAQKAFRHGMREGHGMHGGHGMDGGEHFRGHDFH